MHTQIYQPLWHSGYSLELCVRMQWVQIPYLAICFSLGSLCPRAGGAVGSAVGLMGSAVGLAGSAVGLVVVQWAKWVVQQA